MELDLSDAQQRAGINLPHFVDITIGGTTLTYDLSVSDGLSDSLDRRYTFSTAGLSASEVDVTLRHSDSSQWVFPDEARFNESASEASGDAPEPPTVLPGVGAMGWIAMRVRSKQQ